MSKALHYEKLSLKEIIAYSLSGFGQNMVCGLIGAFVMIFYTDAYLVPPVAVAAIMFAVRIFDAFNDPVMGSIVDRTRTKWGKLRPYILFTPVPVAIMTVLCFCSPALPEHMKIPYVTVTYVLWSVLFTIVDVPYWGLSASMTADTHERSKLLTFARLFCTAGAGLIVLVVPLIIGPTPTGSRSNMPEYRWMRRCRQKCRNQYRSRRHTALLLQIYRKRAAPGQRNN